MVLSRIFDNAVIIFTFFDKVVVSDKLIGMKESFLPHLFSRSHPYHDQMKKYYRGHLSQFYGSRYFPMYVCSLPFDGLAIKICHVNKYKMARVLVVHAHLS